MSKLIFNAREVKQNGTRMYQTAIPAADLIDEDHFTVDRWNNSSQRGYQREINDPHARRLAQFLKGKTEFTNVLPSTIIINFRDKLKVESLMADGLFKVTLTSDEPGYIIDGQHRIEAIRKVLADNEGELDKYEFAVTFTNFSIEEEMLQFRNLNTTANRPAKGLGQVIGHQLYNLTGQAPVTFTEQATNAAVGLTIRLTTEVESPFYGKIAIGGLRKRSFHTTVQSSMVTALLPMYLNGRFSDAGLNAEVAYQYVRDFWLAVEATWPIAMADPESSTIQRTLGIIPLMKVLGKVFNNLTVNPTRAEFESILGEIRANLSIDDEAWNVGPAAKLQGLRRGYTSNKGNSLIADYMWQGVNTREHAKA